MLRKQFDGRPDNSKKQNVGSDTLLSRTQAAADDDTLRRQADRIQARAIRRCGELLKQFDGRGGDTTKKDVNVLSARTRTEAAAQAGLSERQQKTAVRVANVPQEAFEAQVESEAPPTVTALAKQGVKPRPLIDLQGRDPKDFTAALHFKAKIGDYLKELSAYDLSNIGLSHKEIHEVRLIRDAAQDRGEVATGRPKSIPDENSFVATAADIGLSHKDIHERRFQQQ